MSIDSIDLRSEKKQKVRFFKDRYPDLFSCLTPIEAVEYVRAAEGPLQGIIECDEFICAKGCGDLIHWGDTCRFFQRKNGERKTAHAWCVPIENAVCVSPESAVQILLRQQAQS